MATELGQAYHGWPQQELLGQEDSKDATIAQMLDQGSISFGRYAVETLAWEKRSVFTHNRCQEELEKLKAPGLVAQKKAYFEAYYKRIRELKALQANEQTEIMEDYGGDDNGSCKNGEAGDENFEHETFRNGATNIATECSKEEAAEVAFRMESSGAFCCRYLDPASAVTCPDFSKSTVEGDDSVNAHLNNDMIRDAVGACTDSSTSSFREIDMNNTTDSHQCGRLDPETSVSYDELWRTGIEDAELKKNCTSALHMGHMSRESTLLDSPRRMEEIELVKSLCSDDDDEWNVKEAHDAQCSIDTIGPDFLMQKKNISELPRGDNHITGKAKLLVNKQINHSLTPRIKESVSSVRKTLKMQCGTKPEAVKVPQQPKHLLKKSTVREKKNASAGNVPSSRLPSLNHFTSDTPYRLHKVHPGLTIGKEGNNTCLSNAQCNGLPRKNKSASVSSSRPLKGSLSNVTVSSTLSFATQRQSTTPGGIRKIGPRNSYAQSLNGSIHASKQPSVQSMVRTSVPRQITSAKGYATNGVKTSGPEKKSQHGEILKTIPVLNNHTAVPRARDGLLRRPEARSINLPAVSEYRIGSGLKVERPKEGKTNARPRLFEGASKIASAPLARTNKTNLRKQVSSQTAGQLLDGKKSRQEAKPWR